MEDQGKLSLITTDREGFQTIDLVRLSDIFSRAGADAFRNPQFAEMFNDYALNIARIASKCDLSGRETFAIQSDLRAMVLAAREHDVERIILPVHPENTIATYFKEAVLENTSFERHYGVAIDILKGDYRSPAYVPALGPRRDDIPTALNFGLYKKSSLDLGAS